MKNLKKMKFFNHAIFLIFNLVVTQIFCESTDHSIAKKKNMIAIFVEDLGFHDLSFRGSGEIPTFNIDALAFNGILLNK